MDGLLLSNCEEHSRLVDLVSVDDGKLGCSHCALFGRMREKFVVDQERVTKESGILKTAWSCFEDMSIGKQGIILPF